MVVVVDLEELVINLVVEVDFYMRHHQVLIGGEEILQDVQLVKMVEMEGCMEEKEEMIPSQLMEPTL